VASLSQGRTAAAQCGLFTRKSVPVIFEPPCIIIIIIVITLIQGIYNYIPETSHVSRVYSVAAFLCLQFVLHVMLFRP